MQRAQKIKVDCKNITTYRSTDDEPPIGPPIDPDGPYGDIRPYGPAAPVGSP